MKLCQGKNLSYHFRFQKLLNMYFEEELKGTQSSREKKLEFINNPDRIKLIVSYFLDLFKVFDKFEKIIFNSMR